MTWRAHPCCLPEKIIYPSCPLLLLWMLIRAWKPCMCCWMCIFPPWQLGLRNRCWEILMFKDTGRYWESDNPAQVSMRVSVAVQKQGQCCKDALMLNWWSICILLMCSASKVFLGSQGFWLGAFSRLDASSKSPLQQHGAPFGWYIGPRVTHASQKQASFIHPAIIIREETVYLCSAPWLMMERWELSLLSGISRELNPPQNTKAERGCKDALQPPFRERKWR